MIDSITGLLTDKHLFGWLTVILSLAGMIVSVFLIGLLKRKQAEITHKLRHIYIADFFKFFVSLLFGITGLVYPDEFPDETLWIAAYDLRVLVLIYLIYALYSFAKHILELERTNHV